MGSEEKRPTAEEIAKKVEELTKGSAFDVRKEEKRRNIERRVGEMKNKLALISSSEISKLQGLVDKAVAKAENWRLLSKVMVHVDMDAFYASVEVRDQPDLADKPIAVGSNSMLSTCNYIARTFGAMPGFVARKLCPNLVILPANFNKYHAVARQVRDVFAEYCPDFVSGGLDEAYLDLTEYLEARLLGQTSNQLTDFVVPDFIATRTGCNCDEEQSKESLYCSKCKLLKCNVGDEISFGNSAWSVVEEIRFKILLKTRLTSSAGIGPNTMIAKISSDMNKPNGQFVVEPSVASVNAFMADMPVAKVPGIGPVSQGELAGLGIVTCGQLKTRLADIYHLHSDLHFSFLLRVALGMGSTELEHGGPRKSIGTETTFEKTGNVEKMLNIIHELCTEVADSLAEEQLVGRTLTLKLKTADFKVITRAGSCPAKGYFLPSNGGTDLYSTAKKLLEKEMAENKVCLTIRLLGVRISNLKNLSEMASNDITSLLVNNNNNNNNKRKHDDCSNEDSLKRSSVLEENSNGCEDAGKVVLTTDANNEASSSADIDVETADKAESYRCPICNFTFPRYTLLKFNRHIDECLTRSAIRSIKEEEKLLMKSANSSSVKNVENQTTHKKVAKNPQSKNTSQRSILNFLKLNSSK